ALVAQRALDALTVSLLCGGMIRHVYFFASGAFWSYPSGCTGKAGVPALARDRFCARPLLRSLMMRRRSVCRVDETMTAFLLGEPRAISRYGTARARGPDGGREYEKCPTA